MWSHVWCGAVWYSLEFSQKHNRTVPLAVTCVILCIRCGLKSVYFFKLWAFPTQPKTIFSLFLGQVLNYWASFSLFWVGFSSQHLLRLLNIFFFLKTRVIKLLKIYLILKINKYINILRGCGAVRFVRFSYYKTANRTAPCGVVQCGVVMPFCG